MKLDFMSIQKVHSTKVEISIVEQPTTSEYRDLQYFKTVFAVTAT